MQFDRQAAWELVCQNIQSQSLRRHSLAVETVMRAYATKFGEDEAHWEITGLLHDFDWEIHPTKDEHPELGCQMLEQAGWPADIVKAIRGHALYLGVSRDTKMAKALFACDELTGFIAAVAYVRPGKTVREVTVQSVKKKFKDKSFAANVSREEIFQAVDEFGVPLDDHIAFLIEALSQQSSELGL